MSLRSLRDHIHVQIFLKLIHSLLLLFFTGAYILARRFPVMSASWMTVIKRQRMWIWRFVLVTCKHTFNRYVFIIIPDVNLTCLNCILYCKHSSVFFMYYKQTDIQTSSQRFQLTSSTPREILSPDESQDEVLSYEVKELGTHM